MDDTFSMFCAVVCMEQYVFIFLYIQGCIYGWFNDFGMTIFFVDHTVGQIANIVWR